MPWYVVDLIIIVVYGLQHSLLTTKTFVDFYNKILPSYTWNISYSIFSVITIVIGFYFWEKSGVLIFKFTPEQNIVIYHLMVFSLACSIFLFLYCFKYTTSFWQWLGVKQVGYKILKKEMPAYYIVRKEGIKKYIRFPHHTCLIAFFWLHPTMTLDTLLLAIGATIYLYIGTYHQDLRGLRLIGDNWKEYRKNTNLLLPSPKTIKNFINDIKR